MLPSLLTLAEINLRSPLHGVALKLKSRYLGVPLRSRKITPLRTKQTYVFTFTGFAKTLIQNDGGSAARLAAEPSAHPLMET